MGLGFPAASACGIQEQCLNEGLSLQNVNAKKMMGGALGNIDSIFIAGLAYNGI